MISNTHNAPADAWSPDADRPAPAMPDHIARILYVVRVLLGYGRHIAATIETRASGPGFWLFKAVFGTAQLPVIRAYLHRALLRAEALESLLLLRADAGRDVAASPCPTQAVPVADANAHPCDEPFDPQIARLNAERALHDVPADPANLATAKQIEAEVRDRTIGRTIGDISRDLGIIAMICTTGFWDAMTDVIARYHDSAAECPAVSSSASAPPALQPRDDAPPEQWDDVPPEQSDAIPAPCRPRPAARHRGRHRSVSLRPAPRPPRPHDIVAKSNICRPVPAAATGPPRRAAMKHAA